MWNLSLMWDVLKFLMGFVSVDLVLQLMERRLVICKVHCCVGHCLTSTLVMIHLTNMARNPLALVWPLFLAAIDSKSWIGFGVSHYTYIVTTVAPFSLNCRLNWKWISRLSCLSHETVIDNWVSYLMEIWHCTSFVESQNGHKDVQVVWLFKILRGPRIQFKKYRSPFSCVQWTELPIWVDCIHNTEYVIELTILVIVTIWLILRVEGIWDMKVECT